MAESTLSTFPKLVNKTKKTEVKELTYWGAVRSKLLRDKITMAAMVLGAFMIVITLAGFTIIRSVKIRRFLAFCH